MTNEPVMKPSREIDYDLRFLGSEGDRHKLSSSVKRLEETNELFTAYIKPNSRNMPKHSTHYKAAAKSEVPFSSAGKKAKTESQIFLPRIARGNVSMAQSQSQDYKMTMLVNELEEKMKDQLALHDQKFDIPSDSIVMKSMNELNVALLSEYLLPKFSVIRC